MWMSFKCEGRCLAVGRCQGASPWIRHMKHMQGGCRADCDLPSRNIAEGTWLGAELLAWEELLAVEGGCGPERYQVRVCKAGVDLDMPSDGTQPMRPDKEQLRLEALRSRQALLQDLRSAGGAVMLQHLQHAARVAAEHAARVAAKQAAAHTAAAQAVCAKLALMCSAV